MRVIAENPVPAVGLRQSCRHWLPPGVRSGLRRMPRLHHGCAAMKRRNRNGRNRLNGSAGSSGMKLDSRNNRTAGRHRDHRGCRRRPATAIRTGPASRSKSANCRSPRSGAARRSIPPPPAGRRTRPWPRWSPRSTQRRLPMEAATQRIGAFAKDSGEDRERTMPLVFAGVFDVLNREREKVISGLDRFGERQKTLADGLRQDSEALRAAQAANPPDEAKVGELTQHLLWDQQLFELPPPVAELRLRPAGDHRAAAVRTGAGDSGTYRLIHHSFGPRDRVPALQRQVCASPSRRFPRRTNRPAYSPGTRRASPHSRTSSNAPGSRTRAADPCRRRWLLAGCARNSPPWPPAARRNRCRAARCCRGCRCAASDARSSPPAVPPGEAVVAAYR